MQSMKVRGYADAEAVLHRARKLRALGRISGPDEEYITIRAEEIMARIVEMQEVDNLGDPIEEA
jgi:hypothetical protein